MKVRRLSIYPTVIASSRLRVDRLEEHLHGPNDSYSSWSFLRHNEVDPWLQGGWGRLWPLVMLPLKLLSLLRTLSVSADVTIVQREVLPVNTLFAERIAARTSRVVIWDLDDVLWVSGSRWRRMIRGSERKYSRLAGLCDVAWVGNDFLLRWIKQRPHNRAEVVPTPMKLPSSLPGREERNPKLLTWIGTPATSPFLENLLDSLGNELSGWSLLVVGAHLESRSSIEVICLPWSEENERIALRTAWIGLYPLEVNHPMVEGKSALKSVLYMSYALPSIATPTEATLARAGKSGACLYARSPKEWASEISRLENLTEWTRVSDAAASGAANYDADTWSKRQVGQLRALLSEQRDHAPNIDNILGSGNRDLVLLWSIDTGFGGSERRMIEVVPHLIEQGIRVWSLHLGSEAGQLPLLMKQSGASVMAAPTWSSLMRKISEVGPDVVWAYGSRATIVAALSRLIGRRRQHWRLWMAQNIVELDPGRDRTIPLRSIRAYVDLVVANSDEAGEYASRYFRFAKSKIAVVEPNLSNEWAQQPRRPISPRKPLEFLMVGNNSPRKQLALGLQILSNLSPSSRLTIATDDGTDLDQIARSLGLQERFTLIEGMVAAPAFYRQFDCLLHTSREESVPRVILEARSQGCVVFSLAAAAAGRYADRAFAFSDVEGLIAACRELETEGWTPQDMQGKVLTTAAYAKRVVDLMQYCHLGN